MNTDYLIENSKIREKNLTNRLNCHNTSCSNVKKFADDQNTIYYPKTNQILYGVNKNMRAFGVSDGTCDQINPQIFTQNNICGLGTAGGNPCVPDAYGIQNYFENDSGYNNMADSREGFNYNNSSYFITPYIILVIVVIIFIIVLCINSNNEL